MAVGLGNPVGERREVVKEVIGVGVPPWVAWSSVDREERRESAGLRDSR
jgi:hypothetical protein